MMEWIIVMHFLWKDGHTQTVRVSAYPFTSVDDCNSRKDQVRNYITLWPGETSFTITCERKGVQQTKLIR
jgi:hypothetical protein